MRTASYCWKRKDGRWESRIYMGKSEDGKHMYYSVYGHSYQEVNARREIILYEKMKTEEQNLKFMNSQKVYFNDAMVGWFESKENVVKQSTYINYSVLLDKYIYPFFKNMLLCDMNSDLVNSFLRKLLSDGRISGEGGLSAKTVSDIRMIMIQGLRYINKKYEIAVDIKEIIYPHVDTPEIRVLSPTDQRKLERYLFENSSGVSLGLILSLFCGLRKGEICALTWNDIDLKNHRIHVNKSMNRMKNLNEDAVQKTSVMITKPKTNASCREVPIPDSLYEYFDNLSSKGRYYVLTGKSSYMEPRLLEYRFKKILKEIQVEEYNFHALRHTFATRCVSAGVDNKSLSEILGHANVQITLQRYVHPSIEQKHDQMNKLRPI